MRFIFAAVFGVFLVACDPSVDTAYSPDTYAPVYMSRESANAVSVAAPQLTVAPGKIYAFGHYIFQNDVGIGIHIIDNTNTKAPVKVVFIKIPFSSEVAVKGNYLYSNTFSDLVVFDIRDVAHPVLVKRVVDAYPVVRNQYPPETNVYFECADPAKGVVVRWEKRDVKNPKCRR